MNRDANNLVILFVDKFPQTGHVETMMLIERK